MSSMALSWLAEIPGVALSYMQYLVLRPCNLSLLLRMETSE